MDTYNNETTGAYAPAQSAPQKRKSNALPILGVLLGALLFFFGLFALIGALQQHKTADMVGTSYGDIDLQTRYYANVMVVDGIGTMTEGEKELEDYYLGVFKDGDSVLRYCVLRVEQDSPIYQKMRDYADDGDALIGDLWIKGFFKLSSIRATDGLTDAYNDGLDMYDPILVAEDIDPDVGEYTLELVAETEEEYFAAEKRQNASAIFGGVLFAVIGLAIIIPCALKCKTNNQYNNRLNALPPVDFPAPQQPQGNPYAQPQDPYEEPPYPYAEPQLPGEETLQTPPEDDDGSDETDPV